MTTLRVSNWDRWQSYRSDRQQPPWIKLHRELLRNRDWIALTDAQRCHLVSIWILAADKNGVIPDDAQLIQRMCLLDSEPDLNLLIERGFIDARVTPRRRQGDARVTPQNKTREDKEAEKIRGEENPLTPKRGKRAHPIPPDWKPNEDCIQYGLDLGHSLTRISEMAEDMRIWAGSASGKNTLKKDWFLTFKGWMRRERAAPNGHGPPRMNVKLSPLMDAGRELIEEGRERDAKRVIDFEPRKRITG